MIKLFLLDIEGTTTDINFVHKVLFPYSLQRMESFVLHNQTNSTVMRAIQNVRDTVYAEERKNIGLYDVIETLKTWIKKDRKHGALKEIQGLIWDEGYEKGEFKGHVYKDVKPFFQKVHDGPAEVGIYSSGSVHAQKSIFCFSVEGDLTPFISYYFDTKVGGKREKSSYEKIAQEISLNPNEIHFFSDIPEELEAAEAAGLKVTHVLREGTKPSRFSAIISFDWVL